MTETSYDWIDKYLKLVPALHETECPFCDEGPTPTLYMAWCQRHGMKSCPTYKNKKPPTNCGRVKCMEADK